ncbi:MAG: hypothetical protein IJ741_07100 [Schwartzia sp.]|nr:hypothetical protein [Schwartzia sp. (in: firmicutes)]
MEDQVIECPNCGGIEFVMQPLQVVRISGSLFVISKTGTTQFLCASCGAVVKEVENVRICNEV